MRLKCDLEIFILLFSVYMCMCTHVCVTAMANIQRSENNIYGLMEAVVCSNIHVTRILYS